MLQSSVNSRQAQIPKTIFFLTIAAVICRIPERIINVYDYPVAGAIYELIWLPTLVILFILPVVSVIFWVKEKCRLRSFNLYSIVIAGLAVLSMILFS